MGLAADLGYTHASANPAQRLVRWVAGTRPGGWVFAHSLRHLDDVVGRLSRGRHSAPGLLAGLAVRSRVARQRGTLTWKGRSL